MRIFKTKWFDRFARKNNICDSTLVDAVERAEKGLIDADLGNGIIKQRIARIGEGRSKGHRTIILLRKKERSFFVFGFSKKDRDNLRQDEEEDFKNMAVSLLYMTDSRLSKYINEGDFIEVENND